MTAGGLDPHLQACVDRFVRALLVPSKLLALHPRTQGHAGDAQALPPAIVLGVTSAFERFTEDMLATALYLQGQSFAQIANAANLNNPTVRVVEDKIRNELPGKWRIGEGVEIYAYRPLQAGETGWKPDWFNWQEIKRQADGWMQVRHCLSHGLVSGWRPEVWPGPMRGNGVAASEVLREKAGRQHSLGLDGAITCARIYRGAAEHLVMRLASEFEQEVNWRAVPDFPM